MIDLFSDQLWYAYESERDFARRGISRGKWQDGVRCRGESYEQGGGSGSLHESEDADWRGSGENAGERGDADRWGDEDWRATGESESHRQKNAWNTYDA